ncbi:MAG: DUF4082 domain-containing protein, partial [Rhizobiaceae bacterium]
DTAKPISSISSSLVGATFVEGQHVTITGTAQDFGGGLIAGIEVSTDGGIHWFKANGRENWSYNWVVQASGNYTIMSRAVDDSVNVEAPAAGVQVSVALPQTSSLWTLANTPSVETNIDRGGVELGIKLQSSVGGEIEGIRFFKGFYNIGEHKVSLWTADGTLLATGVSANESLSGWQTVTFSTPIQINAGTTYVASYFSNGFYSSTTNYFAAGSHSSGPLTTVDGGSVYSYGSQAGTFPGTTLGDENYWVDVIFDAGTNILPTAVDDGGYSIGLNGTLVLTIASLVANDTDANGDKLTIVAVGNAAHGVASLDLQTGNVIFTPDAGYTGPASFEYTLTDGRGGTDKGAVALTVTDQASTGGVSLFQPTQAPIGASNTDNSGV